MSQQTDGLPVEPRLFLLIERYANALSGGEVRPEDRLAPQVVAFCVNFFQQFLQNEVGLEITGIDDQSKVAAIRRRLELGQDASTLPIRRLIVMFQDLCDMWPDIVEGGSYDVPESPFAQFHKVYMPRLLKRIEDWARAREYSDIANSAETAAQTFNEASSKI